MFFLNTNRTNQTNLFICDSKMNIRDIGRLLPFGQWTFDKSCVQLKIYMRMFF